MTPRELGETPAYPTSDGFSKNGQIGGMTLYQHYVGEALKGLLANPQSWNVTENKISDIAISQADAIIKRLAEHHNKQEEEKV